MNNANIPLKPRPIHIFNEIVRFEDVDRAGIVYHPIYLNYLERARSQSLLDQGYSFKHALDAGIGIVISAVEMKYIRPLHLEDRFAVMSQVDQFSRSFFFMTQVIVTDDMGAQCTSLKDELRSISSLKFFAHIRLCVISLESGRPVTAPSWLTNLW